jgi:hypothetical protein
VTCQLSADPDDHPDHVLSAFGQQDIAINLAKRTPAAKGHGQIQLFLDDL